MLWPWLSAHLWPVWTATAFQAQCTVTRPSATRYTVLPTVTHRNITPVIGFISWYKPDTWWPHTALHSLLCITKFTHFSLFVPHHAWFFISQSVVISELQFREAEGSSAEWLQQQYTGKSYNIHLTYTEVAHGYTGHYKEIQLIKYHLIQRIPYLNLYDQVQHHNVMYFGLQWLSIIFSCHNIHFCFTYCGTSNPETLRFQY